MVGLLSACSAVERVLDRAGGRADESARPPQAAQSEQPGTAAEPRILGRIGDFNAVEPPAPEAAPPSLPVDAGPSADVPASALPSGTFAGDKALQIAAEVKRLQETLEQRTAERERLRETVTAATDDYRTQMVGVSDGPSDRNAGEGLRKAEAHLDSVADGKRQMEALRSEIVADAALAGYLAEQAGAAAKVAGVVEEDRRKLAMLEAQAEQSQMSFKDLLGALDDDIQRQSAFVTRERRDVDALAMELRDDELYGEQAETPAGDEGQRPSVAGTADAALAAAGLDQGRTPSPARDERPEGVAPPLPRQPPPMLQRVRNSAGPVPTPPVAPPGLVSREPVVAIGFADPDVDYEARLYDAISEAVARNPSASFEVVAVSAAGRPGASLAEAKRHAERVRRSLINMGVPAGRLTQSARTTDDAGSDRVLVFMM